MSSQTRSAELWRVFWVAAFFAYLLMGFRANANPLTEGWLNEVKSKFDSAGPLTQWDSAYEGKNWNCTFYGVSKPKILNQDRVYQLKSEKGSLINSGRQIVKTYLQSPVGTLGNLGPIIDELRFSNGILIGRMSKKAGGEEILAYTKCI